MQSVPPHFTPISRTNNRLLTGLEILLSCIFFRLYSGQRRGRRKHPLDLGLGERESILPLGVLNLPLMHALAQRKEITEGNHKQLDLAFSLTLSKWRQQTTFMLLCGLLRMCAHMADIYLLWDFFQCSLVRAPEHSPNWDLFSYLFVSLCHCCVSLLLFPLFWLYGWTLVLHPAHIAHRLVFLFCSSLRTCPQGPIWSARGTNMLNLISVLTQFRDHIPRAITLSSSAYTQLLDIDFSSMVNRNESSSRIRSLTKTRTTTPLKRDKAEKPCLFFLDKNRSICVVFLGNCV